MKFLATTMLVVFAVMALGSFAAIANDHNGVGDCMASTINGSTCPETASLLELVSFHLNAFSSFSFGILAMAFALLLLSVARLLAQSLQPLLLGLTPTPVAAVSPQDFSSLRKVRRTLALFELSPAL
ncbi:MAG: hypothetical protein Q7R88_01480 [bacterium]|nr:hypothetical protein [bacterium]